MRPILALCALALAFIALASTAEARRGGSCANGSCSVSVRTADATPKDFPLAPKAAEAACAGDACGSRQPVRRVGKAALRVLSAPVRAIRRGCGRRGC